MLEQLIPGDKIVQFEVGDERAIPSRPVSSLQALGIAVVDSAQVVLVELEATDAILAERGRWITTRLTCRVLEELKAPRSPSERPGTNVSFLIGRGELSINGVVVRAGGKSPYEVGRTYVAFLKSDPNPSQGLTSVQAGASPLLLDGTRLKAFPGLSDELDGLTLADVRRAAAKHR